MNLTDAFPDRKMNTFGYVESHPMEFNRCGGSTRDGKARHGDVDEQN